MGANHGKLEGGYVYVMSNPSMAGFYKVGQTQDLERRRLELSKGTSAPLPFKCEYAVFTSEYSKLERQAHQKLERYRVHGKEFFTCDLKTIIKEVQNAYLEVTALEQKVLYEACIITSEPLNTHVVAQNETPAVVLETSDIKLSPKFNTVEISIDVLELARAFKSKGILALHQYLYETQRPRRSIAMRIAGSAKILDRYIDVLEQHKIEIKFRDDVSDNEDEEE